MTVPEVMPWSGPLRELYERFYEVGRREVLPAARAHDEQHAFDREAWRRVGASGLFRLHVRQELGGLGLGLREWAAAIDGFAGGSGDLGFAVSVVAHAGVLIGVLEEFGTPEQWARYLPPLLDGRWVGAVANAEPGAGTDVMALRSRAWLRPDGYGLFARKRSITNVGAADLVLCSARLEGVPAKQAVNVFLVETGRPGVFMRPLTDLMGLRTSPTGDFLARRAELPAQALVGGTGDGLRVFRYCFSRERLLIGFLYLAALRRCLQRALVHAESRRQFGEPIGRNQYVQDKIVRMRIAEDLLATHLAATLAAYLRGEDVSSSLSVIKAFGVEAAIQAAHDLVRLLGGRGLRKQELAEKDLRDLLGLSILGGTVELQKIVIYNETLKRLAVPGPGTPSPSPGDVAIEIRPLAEMDRSLEDALVRLTARIFPEEPALKGRYYYDSLPDFVVVARRAGAVVGVRIAVRRTILLGERPIRLAGVGIGVDPQHQRLGIGTALTERALGRLRELGDELVLAFLLTRAAEPLLHDFGFRRLRADVTYLERQTGELIRESMPCYALELRPAALIDEIEARGSLHLGVGTW